MKKLSVVLFFVFSFIGGVAAKEPNFLVTPKIDSNVENNSKINFKIDIEEPIRSIYLEINMTSTNLKLKKVETNNNFNITINKNKVLIEAKKIKETSSVNSLMGAFVFEFLSDNKKKIEDINFKNIKVVAEKNIYNLKDKTISFPIKKMSSNKNIKSFYSRLAKIDFDPSILTYEVKVSSDVDVFDLNIETEDEKSKVFISNQTLIQNKNIITAKILAADGSSKKYQVTVLKEPSILEEEYLEKTVKIKWKSILLILMVLILINGGYIYFKRR